MVGTTIPPPHRRVDPKPILDNTKGREITQKSLVDRVYAEVLWTGLGSLVIWTVSAVKMTALPP